MATQPTCARFDLDTFPDVCRWIHDNLSEAQARSVVELLTQLLNRESHDDAGWLRELETALMNAGFDPSIVEAVRDRVSRGLSDWRWHQLKFALRRPADDPAVPLSDQEAMARIRCLARQVGGRAGADGADLVEEAAGNLLLAIARFDATARFDPWARAVLHNQLVDHQRRRSRLRPEVIEVCDDAPPPPLEVWESVQEETRALRSLLDAAVFFPAQAAGVDQYAVVSLDLRLRLIERLSDVPLNVEELASSIPTLVDRLLPWRGWELPRRIVPGWPTLSCLWGRIGMAELLPPLVDRVEAIRRAVSQDAPELGAHLLTLTWNTWVNRGKKHLRQTISADAWSRLLEHLYPDRHPSRTEPTP